MTVFSRSTLAALALALVAPLPSHAEEPPGKQLNVPNLGFDKEGENWKIMKSGASMISFPAGGRNGKALRITDSSDELNGRIISEKVPATAGKTYAVHFYGRNISGSMGVNGYVVFYDSKGDRLEHLPGAIHHKDVTPDLKEWTLLKLEATAPEGTASVGVEVRSNKKQVMTAEFDDFAVYEVQ